MVYDDCEALTASEVRQFLRNTLPAYMVPGLVMELPSMPLTPNGKVDRLALPDPFGSRDNRPDRSPPSSSSEKLVAEVWRDLLGVDQVGREDNFFELGGHSLLSIRAVSAIERETGQRIDPRTMFFQTLEEIAAALSCPTAHA
jgi:acyl carrier protein